MSSVLSALVAVALAASPGTVLPAAPPVPPGRVAPLPPDPLAAAIDRRTQGDDHAAAWFYEAWLAQKGGTVRTRAAVQLALGLTYLDLDETNLASALFSKVRGSGTPVAPWGAWYEALADHRRGRHAVAARECSAYRAAWPDGEHADECLVLIGDAWVAAGERGPAIAAYNAYLEKHPDTPREETLRLGIALAVTNGSPQAGIPMLQALVLDHTYHSTGETAQERLDELAKQGIATALPKDTQTECRLASEKKRCGFETEAWQRFQSLAARAGDDPQLAAWVEAQQERFAWSTKQYDTVAAQLAEEYAAKPDAETAWQRYKALARGGQWAAAVDQLLAGQQAHGGSSRFRSIRTELARAQLLAGRYADAVATWTDLGKTGGAFGRESRWLAAYATFRAGETAVALIKLDAVIAGGGEEADAARYYRARTLDALGRADEARAARDAIIADAPMSWYAALAREQNEPTPTTDAWIARDGRWPGPPTAPAPTFTAVRTGGVPVAVVDTGVTSPSRPVDWSALAWAPPSPGEGDARTGTALVSTVGAAAEAVPSPVNVAYEARPDAYRPGFLFDPIEADKLLNTLATEHADLFPWAAAAADLARAGVFNHSAAIVARMYDTIEAAGSGSDARSVALRKTDLTVPEWRNIFLYVRDDHHVARFSWGTTKLAANPEQRLQALRFAFPTAQVDALYRHGKVGSSRVDLQACKLEYSIVSPK